MRNAPGHFLRNRYRQMADDLTREHHNHPAEGCQNSASDEQPAENVDVHVHVMLHLPRLHWNCGSCGCCNGRFLSAFAAKSGVLLDFVSTICAKHMTGPFILSFRYEYRHFSTRP